MKRFFFFLLIVCRIPVHGQNDLRLGIIGTDSSHAVEFTRILNQDGAKDHVLGARVLMAYRGGNPSTPLSHDRIQRFTSQMTAFHVPFVTHIADMCNRVDGILLLSVDPKSRVHEFQEAAACHKPIFVDKPLAGTVATADRIEQFAQQHQAVWFSSSSLRFGVLQELQTKNIASHQILAADVWGPGILGDHYALDLSWYGIHSIELMYALMGPGVKQVQRVHTQDVDLITAVWNDGRVATVRLVRPDSPFGALVFLKDGNSTKLDDPGLSYPQILKAIVQFIKSGHPPVSATETLEIFRFMQAAQDSLREHGSLVSLRTHPYHATF